MYGIVSEKVYGYYIFDEGHVSLNGTVHSRDKNPKKVQFCEASKAKIRIFWYQRGKKRRQAIQNSPLQNRRHSIFQVKVFYFM